MAEIVWTLQAVEDLESITEFIAEDSPYFASLFAADILESTDRLMRFPLSGRMVPELSNPAIREIIFGNYRIPYRVKSDGCEILTVFHGALPLDPSKF